MNTGIFLSALFAPENLILRDGFGSAVPRQLAHLHTQAEYGALLITGFLPSSEATSVYLFKTTIRHRVSPEFIGSRNCVPMAFTAESPPAQGHKTQGSSESVLPCRVAMDQLICVSLSHTHYWYEVGMSKVTTIYIYDYLFVQACTTAEACLGFRMS